MEPGQIADVVDQAEDALVQAAKAEQNNRVFQRGQELVRVTRLDDVKDDNGVRRKAGAMVITAIDQAWLTERLDTVADWRVLKQSKGGWNWVPASPRWEYVDTLLKRRAWRFPVLRGITTCPTLDVDGRIVQAPGFDEGTGLYLDFKPGDFPVIPERPTLEDAKAALKVFANPLRAIAWSSLAARSVALSAGLTALVRSTLRAAPLHAFDAPTKGTGKSLCCDWVGIIKTGQTPPAMSQGKDDGEDEKRLSACLYAGDNLILIDNCARPLEGDFLCSMMTQEVVQARILGKTKKVVLPSTAFVIASGNNLVTRGDMTRRVIVSRLDAHCERPEEREFNFDVRDETRKQRPAIVAAGLTLLRAYIVAGRPKTKLTAFGSFEAWSSLVRQALVWVGEADPCESREQLEEGDSEAAELVEVMDLWQDGLGSARVTVGKILGTVKDITKREALVAKLSQATGSHEWNALRVGQWLRRFKDRVHAGRAFRVVGNHGGVTTWALVGAKGPEVQLDLPA